MSNPNALQMNKCSEASVYKGCRAGASTPNRGNLANFNVFGEIFFNLFSRRRWSARVYWDIGHPGTRKRAVYQSKSTRFVVFSREVAG
jgi:hypothetical protein